MSPDAALLRETFERAKRENGGMKALGLNFYKRLPKKYSSGKELLQTAPEEQHKKLMTSLGAIVGCVEQPDKFRPYLRAMGIRNSKHKTKSTHFGAVGENLLAVLSEHLSKEGEWTPAMQASWEAALAVAAKTMMEAADNPEQFEEELAKAGYGRNGFRRNAPPPWLEPASATVKP